MPDPKPIHRDPDKAEAILQAALREFAEHGFHATDVQVVADQADVGKGTVYRYFDSKEGLFRAVAAAGLDRLEEEFTRLIASDLPFFEMVQQMGQAYASVYARDPEYAAIVIQEIAELRGAAPDTHQIYRERYRERDEALIRRAIDEGVLRPVDPGRMLLAIGDAIYGVVLRAALERRMDRVGDDIAYLLDLLFDGIRTTDAGADS